VFRLLILHCEAVGLTPLACRIAGRILKFEPSQPELTRSKPLPDACVAKRLLLNVAGLICARRAKLPEKRSPAFRALVSLEIIRAALLDG
jgi:hypothetical protein